MDEISSAQLHFDFLTGRPSAIGGAFVSAAERSACTALNRRRARGIVEAAQSAPSRESIPADVWSALFNRKVREWDIPLIPLAKLGLHHDEDGFLESEFLIALPPGAEASPYLDRETQVVYKLFDLRPGGAMGKRIGFEINEDGERELLICDGTLKDMLEKISVLHEAGALATEIAGLSEDGGYLIVKQPLAFGYEDFQADRDAAVESMRAVPLRSRELRSFTVVTWVADQAWMVSDLHERNIMRDAEGRPTIIDALTGPVPPLAYRQMNALAEAVDRARDWREGRPLRKRSSFDDVPDEAL